MANWQFDDVVVVAVLRSLPSDVIALSLLFFRGLFQGCCQVPTSSSVLHLIQQCGEMIVFGLLCLPRSRTTFCMSARGCYREEEEGQQKQTDLAPTSHPRTNPNWKRRQSSQSAISNLSFSHLAALSLIHHSLISRCASPPID